MPLALILTVVALQAGVQKAHRHGVTKLEVASEGKTIALFLEAPAKDILGFEHKPKSAAQKNAVSAAKERWQKNPLSLFSIEGCQGKESSWEQKFHGKRHSEVVARVTLSCQKAVAGRSLEVRIKKHYPGAHKVRVKLVGENNRVFGKSFSKKVFTLTL